MLALCLDTLVPMIKREGMPGWIQEFEMGGGGVQGVFNRISVERGGGGGGCIPRIQPGNGSDVCQYNYNS